MATLSDDLRTLSYEAYVYFYPLVTMDVTRRQFTNTPAGTRPGMGPANTFHHIRQFPAADFRAVVRPNFDTLYSSAFLDLTAGPVILRAKDTGDRYYMLPLLDMWTDVFANPGKRTTGTGDLELVITAPGYTGDVPPGIEVVAAPTPYVWIIGRTQTNGPADYAAVNAVQDGYTITVVGEAPEQVADATIDLTTEPLTIVNSMTVLEYFAYAADLLAVNPPHSTDFSQLARLAALGIERGKPFDTTRFSAEDEAELEAGRKAALGDLVDSGAHLGTRVNGWTVLTDSMGVYGNNYFRRAAITLLGLGANPPEDAVYPLVTADADGDPVVGDTDYVLHFAADALPPAGAFWSVTMYDDGGFQVANELNRFAIGDRDALTYNSDGSLDIYIQHTNPGPDRQSNWLPAPLGPVGVTMRLYAPLRALLDGDWAPPPLHKA